MSLEKMKKWVRWNAVISGLLGCLFIGFIFVFWIWGWSLPVTPPPGQDGVDFAVQSSGEGIVMMVLSVMGVGSAFAFFIISLSCFLYYKRLCGKGQIGRFGVPFQVLTSILSSIGVLFLAFFVIGIFFG
ncbi:hypothetical protein U27_03069 [Candidatus Vecturithrix granuli]|uniref:Uncharacterized protein n=1 Tax=Vecturithrix granuli TaxID=1499967 RepID=A0A081BUV2_VECG1|nr:hypothetical protein U27_03069 [Candidatus Vecturithrix granuli]